VREAVGGSCAFGRVTPEGFDPDVDDPRVSPGVDRGFAEGRATMWRELVSGLFEDVTFSDPTTAADIRRLEEAFGLTLPDELKTFLLESNGVSADYAPLVWPVDEMIEQNRSFRENEGFAELYMPFDCLFFFGGDGGGDQFAYRVLAGQIRDTSDIYRWEHECDDRGWFASNLKDFFERWVATDE
jgi:hypothetical protein